jgi:transposase
MTKQLKLWELGFQPLVNGFSTIGKWVKQLQQEREGVRVKQTPMTPEQLEIRELKKRNERLELEKEILKKATALLMSDSMNNSR